MFKKIKFTKTEPTVHTDFTPVPAKKTLPDWYKNTGSYINNLDKINYFPALQTNGTIKKCMPVFDALTSGYIISTPCDIAIRKMPNGSTEYHPSIAGLIQYHDIVQAPYHPDMNREPYPKIINPWSIQTPAGYSCLFIPPVHSGNKYFTILEGIVDTDKYHLPINFVFTLNDPNFDGIIPAGTPIVQVIPFKRDSWKIEIGIEDDLKNIVNLGHKLRTKILDRYKTMFWSKKDYS
jgi:hypothetical protein